MISGCRTITRSLAWLCIMTVAGCHPSTNTTKATGSTTTKPLASNASSNGASGSDAAPVWPFWPVGMRLHPLTRLATDPLTGDQIIECRVEFTDDDNITSKAVGQLTLQVYADGSTPTGSGALETWNQDLRDLTLNKRQYDDVTRTYLFRLQTAQPLPVGCELRAFFLSADGRRMNAEMRLRQ